jgi:hypothetical protein
MARNSPTPGETISDASGNHQLISRWVPFGQGFNFHSIIWRTRDGNSWGEKLVITQEEFEQSTDRRRWISSLHSFDPTRGTAIIKVAEGDAPRDSERVHFNYSWREWDLAHNRELRYIRPCGNPHELFDAKEV